MATKPRVRDYGAIRRKNNTAFYTAVREYLKPFVVKDISRSQGWEVVVNSFVGHIRVSTYCSEETDSDIYTVFTKIDEVDFANEMLKLQGFNAYSGKYNFHLGGGDKVDSWKNAYDLWMFHIQKLRLLPSPSHDNVSKNLDTLFSKIGAEEGRIAVLELLDYRWITSDVAVRLHRILKG